MAEGNDAYHDSRNDTPCVAYDETPSNSTSSHSQEQTCVQLNQAYMALEKVRRLNLFISCQQHYYDYHSNQGCTSGSTNSGGLSHLPPRFSLQEEDYQACAACVIQAAKQGKYVTPRRGGRGRKRATPPAPSALCEESTNSPGSPRPLLKWKSKSRLLRMSMNTNAPPPPLHSFLPSTRAADLPIHERCLTCGAPACARHSSPTFRKEADVVVCHECAGVLQHFSPTTTSTTATASSQTPHATNNSNANENCDPSDDETRIYLEKLIDLYDHAKLLLEFSLPFVPAICEGLESETSSHNKLKVGGSSVGIMSGICGLAGLALTTTTAVAAAAAAPPLLIASVLFGTSATAVPLGTNVASRFFSQPNKMANRLLALYGIVLSVLVIVEQLHQEEEQRQVHEVEKEGHTCTTTVGGEDESFMELHTASVSVQDQSEDGTLGTSSLYSQDAPSIHSSANNNKQQTKKSDNSPLFSISACISSANTANSTSAPSPSPPWAHLWHQNRTARKEDISRSARLLTRTGLGAFLNTSLSFLSFTGGGALAGATIVLEAKALRLTLQAMEAGDPCEKDLALKAICQQANFPSTVHVERECRAYILNKRDEDKKDKVPMEMVVVKKNAIIMATSIPAHTTESLVNSGEEGKRRIRFTDSLSTDKL